MEVHGLNKSKNLQDRDVDSRIVTDATRQLSNILDLLTSMTGRMLQVSDRKAAAALGAATNAIVGTTFATATMSVIGSLGTASTGTAIAGLFGAAKSTASLYWLGGLVGGGVAAGTVVLGAGALGAGIYGSVKVRQAFLGHARHPENLSESELKILQALQAMAYSIRLAMDKGEGVRPRELELLSKIGISPLLNEIDTALAHGLFDDLTMYNRARFRGHVINLRKGQRKLEGS